MAALFTPGIESVGAIVKLVRAQLPRQVEQVVELRLISDPWMLRTKLVVIDQRQRKYECYLDHDAEMNNQVKVPDEFIAHLCAMVI